jgi:hypothetical protein
MFPFLRAELFGGPLPNELTGLIPKVNIPAEEDPKNRSPWAKELVPDGLGRSWAAISSRLAVGPTPNEAELKAPSKGSDTFKYCAVSPRLSKDWLKREKDGAISRVLACTGASFGLSLLGCWMKRRSVREKKKEKRKKHTFKYVRQRKDFDPSCVGGANVGFEEALLDFVEERHPLY